MSFAIEKKREGLLGVLIARSEKETRELGSSSLLKEDDALFTLGQDNSQRHGNGSITRSQTNQFRLKRTTVNKKKKGKVRTQKRIVVVCVVYKLVTRTAYFDSPFSRLEESNQ